VSLVSDPSRGTTFRAKIDVLESMGAEYYAYFSVESERVSSAELEELAHDAGSADLPHSHEGTQVVARLGAESKAKQGEELELWFNAWHLHLFDPESGKSLLAAKGDGNGSASSQPAAAPAASTEAAPTQQLPSQPDPGAS
jgi:hypothetical protein